MAIIVTRNLSKKFQDLLAVDNVNLEPFVEGKCVQLLHVGPYDAEQESMELMKEFAEVSGDYHKKGKKSIFYKRR